MMNKINIQLWIIFIVIISFAYAIPPIPTEFYGTVTIYDINRTPMPYGTDIDIYAGNLSCGSFSIVNSGYYGVLSCLGDDNYTNYTEGAIFGQNIIFRLNNETAQTFGDTVWYYGEYHMVNITPEPRCPNGWCEVTESCITCAEDCGLCPRNTTGNTTQPPIIPPSSGSSSSSSSSGGGSSGGGGEGYSGGAENITMEVCQEDWLCTSWQPDICPISEQQNRSCVDLNECNTELNKPELNKSCTYIGTCFDFFRNQDETDIDCGGQKCEPCDNNKRCLFDFDCKSGFCNPLENICAEPTCNDNFKNQGEGGIDCDGPCAPCERPTLEEPGTIIRFMAKGCGPFPWLFVVIASIFTLAIYVGGKIYIRKVKESPQYKKLKKIDQLVKMYNLDRDLHAFVIIVILLEIAVSLYLYYLCEIAIWLFVMMLIIIPLILAVIIKSYVYDEKHKNRVLKKLVLRHEEHLEKLIKLERDEVTKEEKKIYRKLSDNLDYKKMDKKLALQLKDIRYLLEELIGSKEENPFELENSLSDAISDLDKHQETIDADESTKELQSELKLVERIHRDILQQYKDLREEKKLEEAIAQIKSDADEHTEEEKKEVESKKEVDENPKEESKAEKTKSEEISNLLKKSSGLHKDGKLEDAEKAYKGVLSRDPTNKQALYYLASLYNQLKKTKESYELYKKIIAIDPGYKSTKTYYESLKRVYEK